MGKQSCRLRRVGLLQLVRCTSAGLGAPNARLALNAAVRDTQRTMPEESATPDLVGLTRLFYEVMDREWGFAALADFFASDAVW